MRLQLPRRRTLRDFGFHPLVQFGDLLLQPIQRLQQMLPPLGRIGQQLQLLQLRPSGLRPQLALALHALAQRQRVQLILHLRPRLHLLVAMHQQLPHIPLFQARHPDLRKPILQQQLQQMLGIAPVGLLLAYFRRSILPASPSHSSKPSSANSRSNQG